MNLFNTARTAFNVERAAEGLKKRGFSEITTPDIENTESQLPMQET